jgi:microsomal dipeptidase-like Zn-dependent dipeptidase
MYMTESPPDSGNLEKVRRIHRDSIIIDSMGWGPNIFSKKMIEEIDRLLSKGASGNRVWDQLARMKSQQLVEDASYREKYVAELRAGGVTAVNHTISPFGEQPWTFQSAVRCTSEIISLFDLLPQVFRKVTKADDIRKAKDQQRLGVIMNFQNTEQFGRDLENLSIFKQYGVRVVQLTYNIRNIVGSGCTERADAGLSSYGLDVVEALNRLHMLIDLSHCGYRTTADAIECSKDAVAFTHTFAKHLCHHDT